VFMNKIISFIFFVVVSMPVFAWPTKDITIIVPYPPGGTNDRIARQMAPDLESILKVGVKVLNMPGAASAVAVNHIVNNNNDNHTFMLTLDDFIFGQLSQTNSHLDKFTPITIIGRTPFMLVGNKKSSVEQFKKQIQNQATVNLGGGPIGQSGANIWINQLQTNVIFNNIPYKGSTQMIPDLVSGTLDYAIASTAAMDQSINSGFVTPIMISSTDRIKQYPKVPTFQELGIKGNPSGAWWGMFTRTDTTPEAIDKMSDTVRFIVKNNDGIQQLKSVGVNLVNYNVEDSKKFINSEINKAK